MELSARERQLLRLLMVLLIIYVAFQIFALVWVAVGEVADVLLIFVAAWAVAYLLGPLVRRIDDATPLNRALSVVTVYFAIALVLTLGTSLVVPPLTAQLNDLVVRAPEYGDRAAQTAVDVQRALERFGIPVDVAQLYGEVPRRIGELAGAYARDILGVVSAAAGVFFNLTLILIIAFLMLMDGDALWQRLMRVLNPELRSEAELLRQSADRSFGGFIRGSLLLGIIYGLAILLILTPLGVPSSGVLSLVSGLAMLIPFFGPIIAMLPVLAVTFLGAPDRLLWVFLLVLAVQQVVLNVVGPRVMSRSVGIHPIFVFAALLLGARLAGLWGVFLAVPVAGIVNIFARYYYELLGGRRTRAEAAALIGDQEASVDHH